MRILLFCLGAIPVFLLPSFCYAESLPPLNDTRLFSQIVQDCHPVDLQQWKHPTRSLLLKYSVKIEKVEICNDDKYPIFFVQFPYDPQGETKDYFNPLFDQMRVANGGWSYSFVALSDNTVLNVRYRPDGVAEVDYEMYAP